MSVAEVVRETAAAKFAKAAEGAAQLLRGVDSDGAFAFRGRFPYSRAYDAYMTAALGVELDATSHQVHMKAVDFADLAATHGREMS